jgi:hypothetical protein
MNIKSQDLFINSIYLGQHWGTSDNPIFFIFAFFSGQGTSTVQSIQQNKLSRSITSPIIIGEAFHTKKPAS